MQGFVDEAVATWIQTVAQQEGYTVEVEPILDDTANNHYALLRSPISAYTRRAIQVFNLGPEKTIIRIPDSARTDFDIFLMLDGMPTIIEIKSGQRKRIRRNFDPATLRDIADIVFDNLPSAKEVGYGMVLFQDQIPPTSGQLQDFTGNGGIVSGVAMTQETFLKAFAARQADLLAQSEQKRIAYKAKLATELPPQGETSVSIAFRRLGLAFPNTEG